MKETDRLLPVLFALIWILAIVHVAAEYYYWYWTYRWFDIPMHFLGGVWLGFAGLWAWGGWKIFQHPSLQRVPELTIVLLAGAGIGLLWEVYEYGVWQLTESGLPLNYYADSLLDLIMDTLGALCGYAVYYLTRHNSKPNTGEVQ